MQKSYYLCVSCECNSQCSAVASFLRDPANVVKDLNMYWHRRDLDGEAWRSLDAEEAMRDISTSLVRNIR